MASPQPEPSMEEILASIRKIISEDEEEISGAIPNSESSESLESSHVQKAGETTDDASSVNELSETSSASSIASDIETPGSATMRSASARLAGDEPQERKTFQETPSTAGELSNEETEQVTETSGAVDAVEEALSQLRPIGGEEVQSPIGDTLQSIDEPKISLDADAVGIDGDKGNEMATAQFSEEAIVNDVSASVATDAFRSLSQSIRVSGQGEKTLEDLVTELLRPLIKDWLDQNLPTIVEEKVQDEVQRIARRSR